MKVYFEVWLRGLVKDRIRKISGTEEFHPHITLVRPGEVVGNSEELKSAVVEFCEGRKPISFVLGGSEKFSQCIDYVPVSEAEELLEFSNVLEEVVKKYVSLCEGLGDKTLHVTKHGSEPLERTSETMTRLTVLADKRIWFSYDFLEQRVLDREESLGD
jgi:hypothetical protein